eukprot:2746764-Rhodomonas_salina.4
MIAALTRMMMMTMTMMMMMMMRVGMRGHAQQDTTCKSMPLCDGRCVDAARDQDGSDAVMRERDA